MSLSEQTIEGILKKPKKSFLIGNKTIKERKFKFLYAGVMGIALAACALTGTMIRGYLDDEFPKNNFSIVQQKLSSQAKIEIPQIFNNNPLILAGRDPNSSLGFSIDQAVDAWFYAGMDNEDIEAALSIVEKLSPIVYGVDSTSLKNEHLLEIQKYEEILNSNLLEVQYNLENHIEVSRTDNELMEKNNIVAFYKYEKFNPEAMNTDVLNVKTGATYEEAEIALKQATTNAGLAYLKLPLDYYSDPNLLIAAAERLELANHQLQDVLNINGKVLGLNGLVGLNIGRPNYINEDGKAENLKGLTELRQIEPSEEKISHFIPKEAISGITHIETTWQALGHEWVHAWMVGQANLYGTSHSIDLSEEVTQYEQRGFLQKTINFSNRPQEYAKQANQLIEQFGQVDSRLKEASYLNDPSERMAFVLGAFFGLKRADALYEKAPFLENGYSYPTQQEVRDIYPQIELFIEKSAELMVSHGSYTSKKDIKSETAPLLVSSQFKTLTERRNSQPEYSELQNIRYTRTPSTK